MKPQIKQRVDETLIALHSWLGNYDQQLLMEQLIFDIIECFRAGGKVILAGNGGSASQASHLAGEFLGKCIESSRAFPAIALSDSSVAVTAISNDWSFHDVFSRQLNGLGTKGDVFIAISTSGRSANILRAIDVAEELTLKTFIWTSEQHQIRDRGNIMIAPTLKTPVAQELHLIWSHLLAEEVEMRIE
jgi:D-sedoheptulose 7-phosphate isomerase